MDKFDANRRKLLALGGVALVPPSCRPLRLQHSLPHARAFDTQ